MQTLLPGGLRIAWFVAVICCLVPNADCIKRCYECRSRGPKGDCRDSFRVNSSSLPSGVTTVPCAVGWCGKIIDGTDATTKGTERLCLPSAPTDNEERCAETLHHGTKVFMCFCEGDLCNDANTRYQISVSIVGTVLAFFLILRNMLI